MSVQPSIFKRINRLLANLLVSRRNPYRLKAQQWVRTHNSPEAKPQYHIRSRIVVALHDSSVVTGYNLANIHRRIP